MTRGDDKPITMEDAPLVVEAALACMEDNDPTRGVKMKVNGTAIHLTPYEAVLLRRTVEGFLLRQGVTAL